MEGTGGVRRGSIRPWGSSQTTGCNTRSVSERAPSPIGRITLGTKPAGERRTGNLYAPLNGRGLETGALRTAPALDPHLDRRAAGEPVALNSRRREHSSLISPGKQVKAFSTG